jgi:hypothetical protein
MNGARFSSVASVSPSMQSESLRMRSIRSGVCSSDLSLPLEWPGTRQAAMVASNHNAGTAANVIGSRELTHRVRRQRGTLLPVHLRSQREGQWQRARGPHVERARPHAAVMRRVPYEGRFLRCVVLPNGPAIHRCLGLPRGTGGPEERWRGWHPKFISAILW